MHFAFSEEEALLQDSVRKLCSDRCGSAAVRAAMESRNGFDPAFWSSLTTELGLGGVALPEALGGAGMGHVGLAIVLMEMGRVLAPSPYLSSIAMAAQAIRLAGTPTQQQALLPELAAGRSIAALAWRGTDRSPDVAVTLDGTRLHGEAGFVPFAHVADRIVVAARRADATVALVCIAADGPGVTIERRVSLDLTRPLSTLRLDGASVDPAAILGDGGDATPILSRVLDLARIALAAEQAGGAEAVLDMTVAYSQDRVQFGRPIGSFQALKHRMADMLVEAETAKTAAFYAACVADAESDELAEAAAIASSCAAEAFQSCAGNAIQLHGGIGFTWEHDAHLYFKRARADAVLLGDASAQKERLAAMIGLEGAL